jgi:opacity protein-like surface antigen
MKKLCLLLIPALMVAAPAFGQMEAGMSMMSVGAGAGYALPLGDFSDWYDGSLIVGLNGCYMFTDMYGVEVGVDWAKFPVNSDFEDLIGLGDLDINAQYIPVTLDFLAAFPAGSMSPYVKGGVGYYFGKPVGDDVADDADSENDFGINAGGGVKIPFGATTMFDIGLTYHYILTEDSDVEGSFNTSFLGLKAGIGMKF